MKPVKYKSELPYSYTLGITLTIELLEKKHENCIQVFIHSTFNEGLGYLKVSELCKKYNIEMTISDKAFNILSQKENCYCIGVFNKYKSSLVKNNYNNCDNNNRDNNNCYYNCIVLVNPSNAGNLGTIVRSAVGFGIKNIAIIKPAVDIFDPKTIRASMGSIFSLNFSYYDTFEEYKNDFPEHNIYPFMLKAKNSLANTKFIKPASLVFGNEATGLPDSYLQYNSVIISHSKEIDSLNLPIAMSIAIYELTKNTWNN